MRDNKTWFQFLLIMGWYVDKVRVRHAKPAGMCDEHKRPESRWIKEVAYFSACHGYLKVAFTAVKDNPLSERMMPGSGLFLSEGIARAHKSKNL